MTDSGTEAIADRYRRRAAAFTDTVAAVAPDRWSAPSPCEGWTARDVVRHVVETQGIFEGLVGRELQPGPSVDDDPLAAWTSARDQVQVHLDDPVTAEVGYEGHFGPSTFETSVDRFLSMDLVVHRWDLARATGLPDQLDDGDVAWVIEQTAGLGDAARASGKVFGPELEPPAGADRQTRMLAFTGRRAW